MPSPPLPLELDTPLNRQTPRETYENREAPLLQQLSPIPHRRPVLDLPLGREVQPIQEVHRRRVLQDLRDLYPRRQQLQHVPVVLQRPPLVPRRVPHLERVLQRRHELLDLPVVQHPRGYAPLGREPLQEIHPLDPVAVLRPLDGPRVGREGYGELVLRDKVERALREPLLQLPQDAVLFLDGQVSWEVRKVPLLHGDVLRRRLLQEVMGAVELVAVGRPSPGVPAADLDAAPSGTTVPRPGGRRRARVVLHRTV